MKDLETNLYRRLPRFREIDLEKVPAQLDACLQDARIQVTALVERTGTDFDPTVPERMNDIAESIDRIWSPITHLNGVADCPELREIFPDCLSKVTDFHNELGQNRQLFECYMALRQHLKFGSLDTETARVVTNAIRDFRLAGVDLDESAREEFSSLKARLSDLGNRFERNLLDATDRWHLDISDEKQLSGLPQSAIDLGRQAAQSADIDGWRFSLQMPSYLPVIRYADDRELRAQMYKAYSTRASEKQNKGEQDNTPVVREILRTRQRLAELQKRPHFADYALTTKMATDVDEVISFLTELAAKAKPIALQELTDLMTFVKQEGGPEKLKAWDISYYSEKLRQQSFSFSIEEVREYFPVNLVLEGMFEVVTQLFGVTARVASAPDTWHKDVDFYELVDDSGSVIGAFYTDLFARQGKRGGAWMDTCLDRRRRGDNIELPVAYLTCNFTPPIDERPSLLTHDEVETLFHEFGHCLHHLLTEVNQPDIGGINGVAWDAIELPSQLLEHWCWARESLNLIAKHYLTRESIPEYLVVKMRAAKTFQSGLQTLRQVEFALFDMRLHTSYDAFSDHSVQDILDEVRSEVAVIATPEFNRFQNSFAHIFAGGYAAGYYGYKWAEVLSSDAFGRFEKEGILNSDTGAEFRQIVLARGGSEDAAELFQRFRGRPAEVAALLRHTGLTNDSASGLA